MSAIVERVRGRGSHVARLAMALPALLAACLDSPGQDGDDGEPQQLLANPEFEEGVSGWTFSGGVEILPADELGLPPSEAGPQVARLGGRDDELDQMTQELDVPEGTQSLELAGLRCFTTLEGNDEVYDTFSIAIVPVDGGEDEQVIEFTNIDASYESCEWATFRVATAGFGGERIQIVFEAAIDEAAPTSFAVDGLRLTTSD